MTTVIATHAVGNMDTWLDGGNRRKELFSNFCSNHLVFKHVENDRVSLVFEGVDLENMKALLGSPEAEAGKAEHTAIDPIEIYIEVDGGQ